MLNIGTKHAQELACNLLNDAKGFTIPLAVIFIILPMF